MNHSRSYGSMAWLPESSPIFILSHYRRKFLTGHGNRWHVVSWLPAVFLPPSLKHEHVPKLWVPGAVAAKKGCPHLPDRARVKKLLLAQVLFPQQMLRPLP